MSAQLNYTSYYKNKTILVTGASGYIGSSLIRMLSSMPCKVIAWVRKSGAFDNSPEGNAKVSVFEADIRDKNIWGELLEKVDVIFHFAAQTSSKIANDKPFMDAEINLLPVINIIEVCQKHGFSPDIVFSGTVTEVGLTNTYPVNETWRDLPITVYDINKLAAEKYLQYYSNQLGNRAVTLRLANVYGPGPRSSSADRGILSVMIIRALNGEPLTTYGEGNFIRDYVYIDDVVEAFLMAGLKIDVLKGNYCVIGSGVGYTIREAFNLIREVVAEKTEKEVKILQVPYPGSLSPIEYRNFVADTSEFSTITGWKARVSLPEGIGFTRDYFLNPDYSLPGE